MAWKHLTFILIPHSRSGIKQISIPRTLVVGAAFLLILTIGVMIFYILGFEGKEYYVKKTKEIINRNQILDKNLAHYDSLLATLSTRIDSIYTINENIPKQFAISERDLKLNSGETIALPKSGFELPLKRVLYLIDRMERKSTAFEYNYEKLFDYCDKIEDYLHHLPSIRPADGIITKEFEHLFDIVSNARKLHPGVDINNVEGTPVVATADGTIEDINISEDLGRYILVDHQNGYKTRYAHLQLVTQMKEKLELKVGDKVTRGQQIGCIGRTGRISILKLPTHVLYSVEHHGTLVNPADYFFASDFAAQSEQDSSAVQNLSPHSAIQARLQDAVPLPH